MNKKREAVQELLLKYLKMIEPEGKNVKFYTEKWSKMSDKDFDTWMHNLKDHKTVFQIQAPTFATNIQMPNLLKAVKALDIKLFHRLKLWDPVNETYFMTELEYMVLKLPTRRMIQFVDHKLSVAESDERTNTLTGQVMKPDQANCINATEVQALYARGLKNTILELIKYRGGDIHAFADYKYNLESQGSVSISSPTDSIVRSAVMMDVYHSGMMLETNTAE
jgi:hypothetical protein